MSNKTRIYIIVGLILGYIIVNLISFFFPTSPINNLALSLNISYFTIAIANVMGISLLFNNGSITKTKFWKFIVPFLTLTFIGILAKVQHWVVAPYFLFIGGAGVLFVYLIRFVLKLQKEVLDWIKLLWVFIFIITRVLGVMNVLSNDFNYLTLLLILLACIPIYQKEKKPKEIFDFDFLKEDVEKNK